MQKHQLCSASEALRSDSRALTLACPHGTAVLAAAAIARRVALVLLVGVALGTGLFFLGLEYLFPKV